MQPDAVLQETIRTYRFPDPRSVSMGFDFDETEDEQEDDDQVGGDVLGDGRMGDGIHGYNRKATKKGHKSGSMSSTATSASTSSLSSPESPSFFFQQSKSRTAGDADVSTSFPSSSGLTTSKAVSQRQNNGQRVHAASVPLQSALSQHDRFIPDDGSETELDDDVEHSQPVENALTSTKLFEGKYNECCVSLTVHLT
jgi:hypothetical protein